MLNVLTIDVEEYFHPTELQSAVAQADWPGMPSRIRAQTDCLLELLEHYHTRATFFILGWIAERHPELVREIADAGHEIGCHSYSHRLVYSLQPDHFRQDTLLGVDAIENACAVRPLVYRAPSYSITERSMWALEVLVECGFTHDSSIYPIIHDRYGIKGFARHPVTLPTPAGHIVEIPVATARLYRTRVAPVGGGAYLRLLPYRYTAAGIRQINREGKSACIYLHPWELDPGQPRLAQGTLSRWRTYTGLKTVRTKLERLLNEFRFAPLTAVHPSGGVTSAHAIPAAASDARN